MCLGITLGAAMKTTATTGRNHGQHPARAGPRGSRVAPLPPRSTPAPKDLCANVLGVDANSWGVRVVPMPDSPISTTNRLWPDRASSKVAVSIIWR